MNLIIFIIGCIVGSYLHRLYLSRKKSTGRKGIYIVRDVPYRQSTIDASLTIEELGVTENGIVKFKVLDIKALNYDSTKFTSSIFPTEQLYNDALDTAKRFAGDCASEINIDWMVPTGKSNIFAGTKQTDI